MLPSQILYFLGTTTDEKETKENDCSITCMLCPLELMSGQPGVRGWG